MLNLLDVVALARAGYTKKDVKELIEMSKSQPEPETTQPETKEQPKIISQSEDVNSGNVAESQPKESEQPAAEPDYKALYEAEHQKVSDLQNKNNRADVSTPEVPESELLDIVRSYC